MVYLENNLSIGKELDKEPLSPLLYFLGSELLQVVINDLLYQGIISLPIQINDP
jgi:hypothetical protein